MILKTSKLELYYETIGHGEPLILLHGNGETHEIFKESISLLSQYFTIYAIDTRGHGKSSVVEEYHYDDMANDIYEFITLLKLDKPTIYGFSDGGIMALLLAIKYPKLLSKIIISGVNAFPKGLKNRYYYIFKMLSIMKSSQMKLMLQEPNITAEMLREIKVPVWMTSGSKDMIKQTHLQYIADHIINCTYTIFPKESHGSYIIHSDKIAKYILKNAYKK